MYTSTTSTVAGAGAAASGIGAFTGGGGAVTALPFTGINVFFLSLTALTLILMGTAILRIARTVSSPRF